MVQNIHGMHHLSKRKRISQKLEEYPHPDPLRRFMDKFIYIIILFSLVVSIPQVLQIWTTKNASSLNIWTWGSYAITNLFWLTYGILHKDRALIATYIGWFIINTAMVVGIILYA